jgi:hypothetical protein
MKDLKDLLELTELRAKRRVFDEIHKRSYQTKSSEELIMQIGMMYGEFMKEHGDRLKVLEADISLED